MGLVFLASAGSENRGPDSTARWDASLEKPPVGPSPGTLLGTRCSTPWPFVQRSNDRTRRSAERQASRAAMRRGAGVWPVPPLPRRSPTSNRRRPWSFPLSCSLTALGRPRSTGGSVDLPGVPVRVGSPHLRTSLLIPGPPPHRGPRPQLLTKYLPRHISGSWAVLGALLNRPARLCSSSWEPSVHVDRAQGSWGGEGATRDEGALDPGL